MKILAWNVRFGGQQRVERIIGALRAHDADVIVLTEYKNDPAGRFLNEALHESGWLNQTASDTPSRALGVLIASKSPIENSSPFSSALLEPHRAHMTDINGITVVGAYLPYDRSGKRIWDQFVAQLNGLGNQSALIVGDFNAGKPGADYEGPPLAFSGHFARLEDANFIDVWRSRNPEGREYTWYSNIGNGFRLDHAFASLTLNERISGVYYSHDERTWGLSDHSIMVVEIR